jgi:hypothetical protein
MGNSVGFLARSATIPRRAAPIAPAALADRLDAVSELRDVSNRGHEVKPLIGHPMF